MAQQWERGNLALDDVLTEVAGLAEQGVMEITLLGQNVNSYGRDLALADRLPLAADGIG